MTGPGTEFWSFFTLPSMGRVVAGLPATGWGEELGGTLEASLLNIHPTPNPSPSRGGG
jgi:hypothetical protein